MGSQSSIEILRGEKVGSTFGSVSDNPSSRNRRRISIHQIIVTFVVFDVAAILFYGLAPNWLPLYSGLFSFGKGAAELQTPVVFWAVVLYLVLSRILESYSSARIIALKPSALRLTVAHALTVAALIGIGAATKTTQSYSRLWFFSWASMSLLSILTFHLVIIMWTQLRIRTNSCFYRAAAVGILCNALTSREIERQTKRQVFCCFRSRLETLELAGLSGILSTLDVDRLYLSLPWQHLPAVASQLHLIRHLSIDVLMVPEDPGLRRAVVHAESFGNYFVLQTLRRPISGWSQWLKRFIDVTGSLVGLFILAPLMCLVAIAIRVESPGPAIFRQKRGGLGSGIFEIWKFRSMYTDKTDAGAIRQTGRDDPRVTRVGRIIRAASIDELPQLFNVLQGSMSLCGPRPHALEMVTEGRELTDIVDYYSLRHRVKPGITGLAQVNGVRGELDSIDKVKRRIDYDVYYIENWSVWLDLKILIKTLRLIIFDRTAY